MNLSRKALLDTMGITPQWVLREQPAVGREAPRARPRKAPVSSPLISTPPPASLPVAADAGDVAQMDWELLNRTIRECRACGLCAGRKQAVPGVGDENADWLFIGEGPGAEEDARGEPFVGQAGKLLDAMLAAIGLQRSQAVYIANAVKCRPPGNRTPDTVEMAACRPYLQRQVALLRPKLIVLLGRVAMQAVLGEDGTLSGMRGKTLTYRDGALEIPLLVTYHPAYLLRNLPDKAKAWEDLCRARALMRRLQAG